MGLCKCPKRKVTNLFCFEHDVNVCEYCLVSDHERCIVQSYIQWLQDSDYNPICILCNRLLSDEQTIRLVCYDVFHLRCLNEYASLLPVNTAPAGYQCPKCRESIFPQNKLASPVAEVLRQRLAETNWAKIGLNQLQVEIPQEIMVPTNSASMTEDESNGFVIVSSKINENTRKNVHSRPSNLDESSARNFQVNNDNSNEEFQMHMNIDRDLSENKYKRRPVIEWLKRLLRSRNLLQNQRFLKGRRTRYYCYLVGIATLAFVLLMMIISHLAPFKIDNDPSLDPFNNPNIRIQK